MSKGVFLREATGLVREAGALDILALASLNISWGLSAFWYFFWGPYYAPGGDLNLGITLVLIPMIFGSLAWCFLASVMPRSGGDYIFNSRILHPLLGFLSSLGWTAVNFIWCAVLAAYVASPALVMLFYVMGWAAGGAFAASGLGIFIIGSICILGFTAVLIWGMRAWLVSQLVTFGFGVLWFVLIWAILGTTTQANFIAGWNAFSATYGSGTYDQIISTAQSAGVSIAPSMAGTLLLMPVAFWGLGYPYFAAFIAGETKKVHRSLLIGLPGALVLCGVSWYITNYFLQRSVGQLFLASVAYVAGNGIAPYSIPFYPMIHLFAGVLTNNLPLLFLLSWGFVAWNLLYAGLSVLGQSRICVAWAFDRIAPAFLGEVSERFHTPVKSMALFAVGGEIVLYIYAFYTPSILVSYSALIPQIMTTFMLTAIAAVILPYRKKMKTVYEASPVSRYKIGSIPLISICGVIYFAVLAVVLYYFFTNPGLGALYYPSLAIMVGIYLFGVVYFYAMRVIRKRQGIDLDLIYKQLPPE